MVPNKKQKSSRSIQPFEPTPGWNVLSLVVFQNGERGFMAEGEDSSSLEFFDLDGDRIFNDPGLMMTIRELGEHAPGDEEGYWALVTQV